MAQTYTIWFNYSFIKIQSPSASEETVVDDKKFEVLIQNDEELERFFDASSSLFLPEFNEKILIAYKDANETLEHIKRLLNHVIAAGGIVFNQNNEVLLIKRKGVWDLPKGKCEEGENLRQTAIREVEEETGIKIETAAEQAVVTYHCYRMQGKRFIKETHWFEMGDTCTEEFQLQKDEGIEEAKWVPLNELENYKENMYPMIWSVLESYINELI
ncbi:MAG: NUDIX domain-containing protein [Chitinophagales bacterium]|nr:NUDIX domain-containing protein [Chitinophagales bacterium]MDW8274204.1 NUDIX domain-containing protein [Chitinophagales bacterium]